MRFSPSVFSLGLWFGVIVLNVSATNYSVTDLGTLGGDFSSATDVNEKGRVVGVAKTGDGARRAFLWRDGEMNGLGTLGGESSYAAAINETGKVVGWAQNAENLTRACLFGSDANIDVGEGLTGESWAADINDLGQVVGYHAPKGEGYAPVHAMLWRPVVLGLDGEGAFDNRALAINKSGVIVGKATDRLWIGFGPHFRIGKWPSPSATNVVRFGEPGSTAVAINDAGILVGTSVFDYANGRATRWSPTQNLGSLAFGSSSANAINNHGQIVGSADTYRFGLTKSLIPVPPGNPPPAGEDPELVERYNHTRHAFLWQNGVMADLNDLIPADSGWELRSANSINDAGQIVGDGVFDGQTRAFLLTPVAEPNQLPFVRITSPADEEWHNGSSITIEVEVNDPDGTIQQVDFLARRVFKRNPMSGDVIRLSRLHSADHFPYLIGSATEAPFELRHEFEAGNYLLLAKAIDDQGATASSAEVVLHVNAPPELRIVRDQISGLSVDPSEETDGEPFVFRLEGNEEVTYEFEASSDLVHWDEIEVDRLSGRRSVPTSQQFVPPAGEAAGSTYRFYRAVAP